MISVGSDRVFIEELATIPHSSELGEKELEFLPGAVEDIHLIPGDCVAWLRPFNGRRQSKEHAELTKVVNSIERVIGVRGPGELAGAVL